MLIFYAMMFLFGFVVGALIGYFACARDDAKLIDGYKTALKLEHTLRLAEKAQASK